jgi:hypothetical protein
MIYLYVPSTNPKVLYHLVDTGRVAVIGWYETFSYEGFVPDWS